MDLEIALNEIKKYMEGDYAIRGLTDNPRIDKNANYEQSEIFLSIVGWQEGIGDTSDMFYGCVYFEYEKGKYIQVDFNI